MQRTDSFEKTLMWERLKAGERNDTGWGGWMVSPTQWAWVWARFRSWWWTGKPDVLQSMGSQGVRHDWAAELNWTEPLCLFIGRTDAEAETPILWPPDVKNWWPWCWERLKAGGEGDDRGWDSWMASPTQWTWVWASAWSWWWTGKPDVLLSMGSQRVGHDWATALNWTKASSRCWPFC